MELNQQSVSELGAKLGVQPEVITKFLTDRESAEVKPFAESLGGLQVFQQSQFEERITNERNAAAEEARKSAIGNTYGAMDKRIEAETGITKNAGESTLDYMTRAAKEKFGTKGNESEEMQRLRADLQAKDSLLKQKDGEMEELKVKHATAAKQSTINADLDAAINTLAIDGPAEKLDAQRQFLKYMLGQQYELDVVDGKVLIKNKTTGEVERDTVTASPMTVARFIEKFAPSVVSLKKPSATSGSGYQGSGNDFNQSDEAASFDFSKYSSRKEFAEDLAKQGVALGGPKGSAIYAKFIEARKDLK